MGNVSRSLNPANAAYAGPNLGVFLLFRLADLWVPHSKKQFFWLF